ncbi:MAG: DUF3343 domain-containing protein [Ezakiella sp.]
MIVVTFHQLTDALMFEESAKKKEPEFRLIPGPRKISSSCGLAARTAMSVEDVQKILDAEGIESDGIYKEDNNEYLKL